MQNNSKDGGVRRTKSKSSKHRHASNNENQCKIGRFLAKDIGDASGQEVVRILTDLRMRILIQTTPYVDLQENRPLLWGVLMQAPIIDGPRYGTLVDMGPSRANHKISQDTFRTLATDIDFRSKVSDDALSRILNCAAWHEEERQEAQGIANSPSTGYVQGMNVLAAPFLYISPREHIAYLLFLRLITHECPLYVVPTLDGVHTGIRLLDICLNIIDPELYNHLASKKLTARIYAFASVLTLSACTPPLSQVLVLWDFLFAYGVHMNILCIIAQLELIRDDLLSSSNPNQLLRNFPHLKNAQDVIMCCLSYVTRLHPGLLDLLTRHPWDPNVVNEINQYERKP